jgi:preprotein translocase subunit SecB
MTDAQQPVFQIQRMYLKDLSLEIPGAPRIFLEQQGPNVEISLDTAYESLTESIHEVTLTTTVTTKIGTDKVVFLVEAKQAGIFDIRNIPAEQMPIVLNVVCPNVIYPYLRANIADVVTRAGFPAIHLAEINFEALYQQKLAQQAQPQAKPNGGPQLIVPGGRPN